MKASMKYFLIMTLVCLANVMYGQENYIVGYESNKTQFLKNVIDFNREVICKSFDFYIINLDSRKQQFYYFDCAGNLVKTIISITTIKENVPSYIQDFLAEGNIKRENIEVICDVNCVINFCYDGK